jgi:hypothetical protein
MPQQGVPIIPFGTPAPRAPQHVVYGAGPDAWGRYFITLHCRICGDTSQKQCFNPHERLAHWVDVYAFMHLQH